jgi:curved DNA-binding protein
MSVKFIDYYKLLGVERDASQDEIQKGYRKLARKFHPDISKEPDAEDRFKELGEAYEVLKDPEARARYDRFGHGHRAGQTVRPPPGWQGQAWGGDPADMGGFSDFFRTFFGDRAPPRGYRREVNFQDDPFRGGFHAPPPRDERADVTVSLREVFAGTQRELKMRRREPTPHGGWREVERSVTVRIPAGAKHGTVLRLRGQGASGPMGNGDLLLKVKVAADPEFRLEGHDLHVDVTVNPWDAVLGAEIQVPTLEGAVSMKVPPGVQPGQKLRLRGKGLPRRKGAAGDLYAHVGVKIPKKVSEEAAALWRQLAEDPDDD